MRDASKNEDGIRYDWLRMTGCRIEIFRWERDLILLTDGMQDSSDAGMRDAGCGMQDEKGNIARYRRNEEN